MTLSSIGITSHILCSLSTFHHTLRPILRPAYRNDCRPRRGRNQRGISGAVDRGPVSSDLPTFPDGRKPGAPGMMEGKGEKHRDCLTPIVQARDYTRITTRQELGNKAHSGRTSARSRLFRTVAAQDSTQCEM